MIELKVNIEEVCVSQLSDSEKREMIQTLLDSMDGVAIKIDTVYDAYASLLDKQQKVVQNMVIDDMSDDAIKAELELRTKLNIVK